VRGRAAKEVVYGDVMAAPGMTELVDAETRRIIEKC
jgi:hypothetical protein